MAKPGRPPFEPGKAKQNLVIRIEPSLRVWLEGRVNRESPNVSAVVRRILEDFREGK
jgi:hypothetical protein